MILPKCDAWFYSVEYVSKSDRPSVHQRHLRENKGTLIGGTPIMHNGSALILSYSEDGLLYYLIVHCPYLY